MATKARKPRVQNIFQDGPYLISALLCEKVLEEKDGVKSAIRMVDRFTVTVVTSADSVVSPTFRADLQLLLRFKKGKAGKKHNVRIELSNPNDDKVQTPFEQSITFEGGEDRGIDMAIGFRLDLDREGIYWIDVYMDEWRITRVPMRVVFVIRRQGPRSDARKPPS